MVIDFRNDPDHAAGWSVVSARTGENLDHLDIWYADDEAGVIRRHARDDNGLFYFHPGTDVVAQLPEERRAIRIVPRQSPEG